MPQFVQQSDVGPQFWQYLNGLRHDDLLIELIQNELDADASHTIITFDSDRLTCQGDGKQIDEAGWKRLSFILGAGDLVEAKHSRIGVKNHGLKACFRIGDDIILRSDKRRMIQTLYKNGRTRLPSPGAFDAPDWDNEAPLHGCLVEVPYRKKKLRVSYGEVFELSPVTDHLIDGLFHSAYTQLPTRLMGIVRPSAHSLRSRYSLTLSHHRLGSVEMYWEAKRGQTRGNGRHHSILFSRECSVTSEVEGLLSRTVREQAYTFKVSIPSAARREIPAFFMPERQSFVGEVAWRIGKGDRPETERGIRRYPIGYESASHSESALSGTGVHFSGPYASDVQRHGASESEWNDRIDDACKSALVDIMASYLLPRYGGRAMELYVANPSNDAILKDIVDRTIHCRALPLRPSAQQQRTRHSNHVVLGPRKKAKGQVQRVVLPMFTWDDDQVSSLLADVCPRAEDQIDPATPAPILQVLAEKYSSEVIRFDENDVIERLQPLSEAQYFPWKSETEWRSSLGDLSVARKHLDIVLEIARRENIQSEQEIAEHVYLPDHALRVRRLTEMFSAVSLPPDLDGQLSTPLLNPGLKAHALFKRSAWKLRRFTLRDYLDKVQLETATPKERELFWRWLRDNQKEVIRNQELCRIAELPVWPSRNRGLVRLSELCEPVSRAIISALGNAIWRPSGEVLNSGLVKTSGQGCGVVRNTPNEEELKSFLLGQIDKFPTERLLTGQERQDFRKFENELALLASVHRIRRLLIDLADEYAVALAKDGYLRKPSDLNRNSSRVAPLHLLPRHIIDRSQKKLDQLEGWAPRSFPRSYQIVEALTEDATRNAAHVPRLQAYLEQAQREGAEPSDLRKLPCIPVNRVLRSPDELALRGRPDYWGKWKTVLDLTGVNAEVQRLYERVGVIGRVPVPMSSLSFFQWLGEQSPAIIAEHVPQVLRHIRHRQGPQAWYSEYPHIPFIPVEHDAGVILVTRQEAIAPQKRIVIPDFDALEAVLRSHYNRHRVHLVIVQDRQVEHPITPELRELGLRTLRELAKEPKRIEGSAPITSLSEFQTILNSLKLGARGRQLSKRLEEVDINTRENRVLSNWRERLSQINDVRQAQSVKAIYTISRSEAPVTTSGGLDRSSGVLYLALDSDMERAFFENIANLVFESPKKFLGSALRDALSLRMPERDALGFAPTDSPEDAGEEETDETDEAHGMLTAAGGHPFRSRHSRSGLPTPGPIPLDSGLRNSGARASGGSSRRPASSIETTQTDDLKRNQYAWHCQACLAQTEAEILAPSRSYVEHHENRQRVTEAHHCDQVSAGGAGHAGNLLILCHHHHLELGDAISRAEVTKGLQRAVRRRRTFRSPDGATTQVQGSLITVRPPQRRRAVRFFFTEGHRDYWLRKASEEGLA